MQSVFDICLIGTQLSPLPHINCTGLVTVEVNIRKKAVFPRERHLVTSESTSFFFFQNSPQVAARNLSHRSFIVLLRALIRKETLIKTNFEN